MSDLWELRKKYIERANFTNEVCNSTPEVKDILKIFWTRGEIAHDVLLPVVRFPC